jgi:tRNA(Ile)-lysidine synthase
VTNNVVASAPDQQLDDRLFSFEEIEQFFASLREYDAVALGVSGGPDSLALLYLFNDWRVRAEWPGSALVLTVDHRLRPESADEAKDVAAHCAKLGFEHKILVWQADKPKANLQAEARDARYRLMADVVGTRRINCLLLAHHRDDQVETFLDRLTRGSGVYGLGGMTPDQPNGPQGLHLVRPLLTVPKSRLLAELSRRNVAWAEDPSNLSDKYKRVRLRKTAALLAEEGLDTERLVKTANRLRRAGEAIDFWVNGLWERHVEEHPAGPLRLPFAALEILPLEARLRFLGRLVLRTTGSDTPLRLSKLEDLERRLAAGPCKQTLAGAVVLRDREFLVVWREAGRQMPEGVELKTGSCGEWDARYRFQWRPTSSAKGPQTLMLGCLADAPASPENVVFPKDWPKESFVCAPAVWTEDKLMFVAGLCVDAQVKDEIGVEICRVRDHFAQ